MAFGFYHFFAGLNRFKLDVWQKQVSAGRNPTLYILLKNYVEKIVFYSFINCLKGRKNNTVSEILQAVW